MKKLILLILISILTDSLYAQTDSVKTIRPAYKKRAYHQREHNLQRKQLDTTFLNLSLCIGINSTWLRTMDLYWFNFTYQGRPSTQNVYNIDPRISYRLGIRMLRHKKNASNLEFGLYINESKTYASALLKLDYYPNRNTYHLTSIRYQFTWLELPLMRHFYFDKKHLFDGGVGFQLGIPIINSSRILGTLDYQHNGSVHELIDQKLQPTRANMVFQIKFGFPIMRYHDSWIRMNIGAQSYLYQTVVFPSKKDLLIDHKQIFVDVQIPLASWKSNSKHKK